MEIYLQEIMHIVAQALMIPVMIGGMGSLFGTLVGGILLGLVQLLGANFFGSGWMTLTGYVFMLIILAVLPNGIFGKARRS